ncbi:MAG: ABC transporter permease [Mycoplasmataceae bacterium]|nr:ABC transporter permease [Mycoplasmataceae bacterium]
MKAVFKLINQHYWNSKTEPIFTFILPIFILGIFSAIPFSSSVQTIVTASSSIPGLIALMITSNATQTVPASIQSFKNSSLFKRIGSTPIKPWMFICGCAIFYAIVFFVEICFMLLLVVIFFSNKDMQLYPDDKAVYNKPAFEYMYTHVNWGGYVLSQIYTIILSISLSLFIISVTKTVMSAQGIGMAIFFFSMFLSGQIIPLSSILGNDGLTVLSYFSPYRYTNALQYESFVQPNSSYGDFVYNGSQSVFTYSKNGWSPQSWQVFKLNRPMYVAGDFWANWFVPLGCIIIFSFIAIKKLSWGIK